MSRIYGFTSRNLYVDLSSGETRKEALDEKSAKDYIGGMGIAAKLLYDLVPPGANPFSPENVFIMATSPFTGTLIQGASRVELVAKSPQSGFWGQGNSGNSAGQMLKYAGYDNLIITGRSEKPVYLKIFDDDIEIRDASHLWGKDTGETIKTICADLGPCAVSCIGPAGENLVKFASIRSKRGGFNKTGMGAVLGSKNLKAIAARGSRGVEVASPQQLRRLTDDIIKRIMSSPKTAPMRQYAGAASWGDSKKGFNQEEYRQRVWKRWFACVGCPIGCKETVHLRGGKYDGLAGHFTQLPSMVAHHAMARVENWDEVARCTQLEDQLGLDGGAVAGVLNLIVRLREAGILKKDDLEGIGLDWGGENVYQLTPLIAFKQGVGAFLAEGARDMAVKIGHGVEKYANHIKGIQKEADTSKAFSTLAFGEMIGPGGAHDARGVANTKEALSNPAAFRKYLHQELGVPLEALDRVCDGPHGYNVARLTKWAEDFNIVSRSLGVCILDPIKEMLNIDLLAELYAATTGIEISRTELLKAGERINNLQKVFAVREGWTRIEDIPGTRTPNEIIMVDGKSYGTLDQLLDQYYEERGWEVKTGIPKKEKLAELGIDPAGY
jgi:aldehyde:ferredoxin oxidoreductase